MAKVEKITLNYAGFNAVRNSPEVRGRLLSMAKSIAASAEAQGCECKADVQPGKRRAHARVATVSDAAARNNLNHNTLLKSLDAGR